MLKFRNIIKFSFLTILLIYYEILGNVFNIQSFSLSYDNVNDSNLTYQNSGIGLAIKYCNKIKTYGDSIESAADVNYYPDVISWGPDSFTIYFVDTIQRRVSAECLRILPNGNVVKTFIPKLFNINSPQDCYFHIDRGECGFLASYVIKGSGHKRYLQIHNGNISVNIDSSISTGWLFSSQNIMAKDTFLVIASVDMNRVTLRKIYSCGNTLNINGVIKVADGSATNGNALMNCALATDSEGTICTAVLKGSPTGDKFLYLSIFDKVLNRIVDTLFTDKICDNNYYYYDDISITSIKRSKFALIFWDNNGVVLRTITLIGTNLIVSDNRIINKSGSKFCSIVSNGNYLGTVFKGDLNSDGITGIEGIVYNIDINGDLIDPQNFCFSDPVNVDIVDNFSTAINTAMDDSGSIAIVWRNGYRIAGSVWSSRCVRHSKGFYISPVEQITAPDSIRFLSSIISVVNKEACQIGDSIRFGRTPELCKSATWISLSDRNTLRSSPTINPFFQFKIGINRNTNNFIDSLTTPEVISAQIHWNTKPSLLSTDSAKINSITYSDIKYGDTLILTSRIDTISLFTKNYDYDSLDSVILLTSDITHYTIINNREGNYFYGKIIFPPFSQSNQVYNTILTIKDLDEWQSQPFPLYFKTYNRIPEHSLKVTISRLNNRVDSLTIEKDTIIILQQEENIKFSYFVSDFNDPEYVRGYIIAKNGSGSQRLDTLLDGKNIFLNLKADSITSSDTFFLNFKSRDIDTTICLNLKLIINHRPLIDRVLSNGQMLYNNDTLRAILDDTTLLNIFVADLDCQYFDTLRYTILTHNNSYSLFTSSNSAVLKAIFGPEDTIFKILVSDKFGRLDSFELNLAYPWYDTSFTANPYYSSSKILLEKGVSLIDGSEEIDTFFIPIVNSGRNNLNLTGCKFISDSKDWLSAIIDYDGIRKKVDSKNYIFNNNIIIKPFSFIRIAFLVTAKEMTGDSLLKEKFILFTDDPRHRADTFNVTLEHNDLPRIISIIPDFITNMPYRTLSKSKEYFFPPHATISITFSEPIDSTSVVKGIQIYSINDREKSGIWKSIPLRYSWFQNYTILKISPCYLEPSPHFNLIPPCGLFIPTDSLLIRISDIVNDRANTPSGPNHLDIDLDNLRNSNLDTLIAMKVDSITFTVSSVNPQPLSVVSKKPKITLTFSSHIYSSSIDTSLVNNNILVVSSKFNNNLPLPFERIDIDSTTVSFTIGRELFYNDTLTCWYRSRYIRDRLGFATDNNKNGIDATIFDLSSSEDDLWWGYKVKSISVVSVEPVADSLNKKDRPEIKISFDDKIPSDAFDIDTSIKNKSFLVISRNSPIPFSEIKLSKDSNTIILIPRFLFFSGDSVFCKFTGFTYNYNYKRTVNIPDNGDSVFCSYEWTFISPKTGFYTYPNPYKPGRDPRHCRNGGPCGIWFKNLHTLGDTLNEVIVSIFSLNTHPVFDSRKSGIRIRFGKETQQPPEWLWDTKNNRGEPVGSGIYLYAICKVDGTLIKKGKLIIVR